MPAALFFHLVALLLVSLADGAVNCSSATTRVCTSVLLGRGDSTVGWTVSPYSARPNPQLTSRRRRAGPSPVLSTSLGVYSLNVSSVPTPWSGLPFFNLS